MARGLFFPRKKINVELPQAPTADPTLVVVENPPPHGHVVIPVLDGAAEPEAELRRGFNNLVISALQNTVVPQTATIDLFENAPATEEEQQKEAELMAMAEDMEALDEN